MAVYMVLLGYPINFRATKPPRRTPTIRLTSIYSSREPVLVIKPRTTVILLSVSSTHPLLTLQIIYQIIVQPPRTTLILIHPHYFKFRSS